jgi:hypothetical protein
MAMECGFDSTIYCVKLVVYTLSFLFLCLV